MFGTSARLPKTTETPHSDGQTEMISMFAEERETPQNCESAESSQHVPHPLVLTRRDWLQTIMSDVPRK